MTRNALFLVAFTLTMGVFFGQPEARAVDVDVDVNAGGGRPRPVLVQPGPIVERRWVPAQIIRREEKVQIEPARIIRREEQVLVAPSRIELRREKVLVQEARIERRWVSEERVDRFRIGPVRVEHSSPSGHWEEVMIPAQYEIVEKEYQMPARYQMVTREVEVPARYGVVARDVVIPGHWEETVVSAPPVLVEERRLHSGLEINLDFSKHSRNRDRHDRNRDGKDRDDRDGDRH